MHGFGSEHCGAVLMLRIALRVAFRVSAVALASYTNASEPSSSTFAEVDARLTTSARPEPGSVAALGSGTRFAIGDDSYPWLPVTNRTVLAHLSPWSWA